MIDKPYSPAKMRERFIQAGEEIARIESTSPRIERDAKYTTLNDSEKARYKALIKIHEVDLAELKIEYALLAKALGGKLMSG